VQALTLAERTAAGAVRRAEPAKLMALLRSDLDWIAMRCLEKDPGRRYETANALAMDIKRQLGNEPVVARPPSRAYQVGKFVRRHRNGVVAGTLVALSLVGGLITAGFLLTRERAARTRAVVAERAEGTLRHQAEEAKQAESARVSRTARELSRQFFEQGKVGDGLAYLVHAAQKNPANETIAPQLVSALASRNFLWPIHAPIAFSSSVLYVGYLEQGKRISVYCEDGTIGFLDCTTGKRTLIALPSALVPSGVMIVGEKWAVVRGQDHVIRVLDSPTGLVQREFPIGASALTVTVRRAESPLVIVGYVDRTLVIDTVSGSVRELPVKQHPATQSTRSANGRWLTVSEHPYRAFELWDLETGTRRATVPLPDILERIVFSLDGSRFVSIHRETDDRLSFRVWSTGEVQSIVEARPVRESAVGGVVVPTFSPDGRWLNIATASYQQVYDAFTGVEVGPAIPNGFLGPSVNADRLRTWALTGANGFGGGFFGPIFFQAGKRTRLITAGGPEGRKALVIRDLSTGQPVLPELAHPFGVQDTRLSEDGTTLFTIDGNGAGRLWDLQSGRLLAEPSLPQKTPDLVSAISTDGREMVLAGSDGKVYRLGVGRGAAQPLILPRAFPLMSTRFFSDAPTQLLWLKRDRAEVIDVASGVKVPGGFTFPAALRGGTFNRGLSLRADLNFLVAQTVAGTWQAWEFDRIGLKAAVTLEGALSGTGTVLLSAHGEEVALVFESEPQAIRRWNLRTGKPVNPVWRSETRIGTGSLVDPGAFSADGGLFSVGNIGGTAKVWESTSGKALAEWQVSKGTRLNLAVLNAGGTRVVTTDLWGKAQLWEAATGRPISGVLPENSPIEVATFSPHGDRFLTRSTFGLVRVWDANEGSLLGEPMLHPGSAVRAGVFTEDGRRVATGAVDWTARVWDAATGQPVTEPMLHRARVVDCGFNPDGRFLWTDEVGTEGGSPCFFVWSIPPELGGAVTPSWLLQLATLCAGRKVGDIGQIVDAPEVLGQLEDIRHQLAVLPANAPYVEWGRWLVNQTAERSIAPGFTITPERAAKLTADLTAQ
jgi:WD40 repeat protein